MRVQVNGEERELARATTVAELLDELGLEGRFVAVAVNHGCVRRGDFAATPLREGDAVEVLAPMAGG